MNKKSKKVVTVATAASTAAAMLFSIASCNKKEQNKSFEEITTINDSYEELGLKLTEDFNINNSEEVKKRAQAIYDISNKKVSVEKIINIIYYFNDKLDSLSLGKTDSEKANSLKLISSDAYKLLYSNIEDDSYSLSNILNDKQVAVNDDEEIFAYMILAKSEDKVFAIENAKIVKEQLNNIENNKKENLSSTSEKYYTNVINVKNNKDLKDSSQAIILICVKSKICIMSGSFLNDEKRDELNKISYITPLNLMFSNAIKKLGINQDKLIDDKRNDGILGNQLTKEEEKYIKEDAKEAKTHPAITNEEKTTTKIDNGGNKIEDLSGKQEEINSKEEVTTEVTEEEIVAPIPDDVITEEEIIGGEVVSEKEFEKKHYIVIPGSENSFDNDLSIGTIKYVDGDINVEIYKKPYIISK